MATHAVALPVDLKNGRMLEQSVEDRGGDGGVFEDCAPFGDSPVGGEDDGAVPVATADHLEEMDAASPGIGR